MTKNALPARPVLFSDLDGTLYREMLHVLWVQACRELGIFDPATAARYDAIAADRRDRRISYEIYETLLVEFMLECMTGLQVAEAERAAVALDARHRDHVYAFTSALIRRAASTHERVAVTGAIEQISRIVAPAHGFDRWYATQMEERGSIFTGKQLHIPPCDKGAVVDGHFLAAGAMWEGSVGIGDTASDILMLERVEFPIAFNPNPTLAEAAETHGWPVVVERKDSIYVHSFGRSRRYTVADVERAIDDALDS